MYIFKTNLKGLMEFFLQHQGNLSVWNVDEYNSIQFNSYSHKGPQDLKGTLLWQQYEVKWNQKLSNIDWTKSE